MKLNECVDETKEASKTATADSCSIHKFYLPEEQAWHLKESGQTAFLFGVSVKSPVLTSPRSTTTTGLISRRLAWACRNYCSNSHYSGIAMWVGLNHKSIFEQ